MASHDVCYLTTTGRRTGRPHRIEIWFLETDGIVHLFAGDGESADWVRNLRRQPLVELELPDRPARRYTGTVVESPDPALRRRMDERYYDTDPDEELTDWARRATVVRLVRDE
jgi:deazaflavin-dependent oxidoreductase (nitroreductase family)